jgi:hypothetical protein
MSKKIQIKEDQNIIDLAIQETGSVEGIFDIIAQNDGVTSVDHIFKFGDEILIDETSPQNKQVRDFYSLGQIIPTTGEELLLGDFNNDFNNDFNF